MRHVRFNPTGALITLVSSALLFGVVPASAQINPQTARGIAQNGAKAAQASTAPQQTPATAPSKTVAPPQKSTQKNTTIKTAPKSVAKPQPKPPAKTTATGTAATATAVKPTDKAVKAAQKEPAEKPQEASERLAHRRDPFSFLVGKTNAGMGSTVVLPPGKAGLQVESLLIQGIVSSPEGMIAVVANPQQRVYFLHEGDQLFDGSVMKIGLEAITFHEVGRDAFGKPTERDVTKRLNNSSGELP